MHIDQYAYFALFSRSTSAAEMTAILGIEPDETTVRGSRRTEPSAVPVRHGWKIVCREPGLCVDEQVARILDRLRPHTTAIGALANRLAAADQESGAVLEIVRCFRGEDAERHEHREDAPNLFGWHLDRAVLDFLRATGAVLDVDEYDMTPDRAEDAGV
ncbi:hypothetical protein GCM10010172_38990 [Paractinoplanes ferrugineus]|uniref:DUF4279 domain-containing protein n=1 Tax=Paractinoplanes ferrugineus TaxID=113564 RepID=A0A919MHI6_9ACTN|nr:DUF4279 domain-containing protein [Actinoplanes ferrugineus]GIE12675.1 hypothetical protein Afe05nite_45150 [Actinoplanes ferrugineus]